MPQNDGGPARDKSLLDDFAGQALQGMLASRHWIETDVDVVAKVACDYADAMLAEKQRREEEET